MQREEILRNYKVENNRIVSPGKFEGEPVFAPYFWDLALQGFADSDNGRVFGFRLQLSGQDATNPFIGELRQWLGRKRSLKLWEDGSGFVHCS